MRDYGYGATWDERPSLGLGRALSAALFYSAAMVACGAAIALSADHVAQLAAPLLTPNPAPVSRQAEVAAGSSHAAIMAKLEAKSTQSTRVKVSSTRNAALVQKSTAGKRH